MSEVQFEIDGYTFHLAPLKVKAQLRCITLLAPILMSLKGGTTADAVSSLEGLPELQKLFADNCRVQFPEGDGPTKVIGLTGFQDMVFERKPARLLSWLVECIQSELGDFLAESGRNLLAATVSKLARPPTSTGGSGE